MISFYVAYKALIIPLLTWLIGWITPSPLKAYAGRAAEIRKAEEAASGGDTTGLDKIP